MGEIDYKILSQAEISDFPTWYASFCDDPLLEWEKNVI